MEDDERDTSIGPEVVNVDKDPVMDDVIMEDAINEIATSKDAQVMENDAVESDMANLDTASIASDGTVDLEQLEQEQEAAAIEEQKEVILPTTQAENPAVVAPMADEKEATPTSAPPPSTGESVDAAANAASSSSSSSSSDSSSSDSSSSDSSDSEVEDVTDQYKQPDDPQAPRLRTMSESGDDEVDAEQWFDEPTFEADGVEVVGVVEAQPQDAMVEDEDEEDVFLTPYTPTLERGSATKRQRPEDDDTVVQIKDSAGEETTSSDPEPNSEDDARLHRKPTTKRKKTKMNIYRTIPPKKPGRPPKAPPVVAEPIVYTSVPAKYDIFNNVPKDDSNFPFLKGDYEIRGGHRAYFTGLWGFTDADFERDQVSKFEYSSSYLHGRREGDRRPYSGTYGGYFNLRQFSGKITKIKEDHIQLHFLRLYNENDDSTNQHTTLEDDEEEGGITRYEVFGEGKNRFGKFLVRGYFSAKHGRMTVRRHYLD